MFVTSGQRQIAINAVSKQETGRSHARRTRELPLRHARHGYRWRNATGDYRAMPTARCRRVSSPGLPVMNK